MFKASLLGDDGPSPVNKDLLPPFFTDLMNAFKSREHSLYNSYKDALKRKLLGKQLYRTLLNETSSNL